MSVVGVPFATDVWGSLALEADRETEDLAQRLDEAAPPPTDDRKGFFTGWNWASPAQALEALKAAGCELPDTKDETLAACSHGPASRLPQRSQAPRHLRAG